MDFSSKDYDKLRASRRRRGSARGGSADGGDQTVLTRTCEWKGCNKKAGYRAPKGRGREGQYHHFCLDHVREYNKSYNYFSGMSDDDVIAYQRDAVTGHRPTRPMGVRQRDARKANAAYSGGFDDPLGFFGGGSQPYEEPAPQRRRLSTAERNALEVLGLEEEASADAIKARYKTLVKRHHPDANQGDRSSEDRLRNVINAYNALRRSKLC